jgi:hypothetical protein
MFYSKNSDSYINKIIQFIRKERKMEKGIGFFIYLKNIIRAVQHGTAGTAVDSPSTAVHRYN